MKGTKLTTLILLRISLAMQIILTVGNYAYSWSQNALSEVDTFLTILLIPIIIIYMLRGHLHSDMKKVLFKFGKREIRMEHTSKTIAYMFFGIAATPVTLFEIFNTGFAKYIFYLHLFFTAMGILISHIEAVRYRWNEKPDRYGWLVGSITTLLLFAGGYGFGWFDTATGELIVASVPLLGVYFSNNYKSIQ